MKRFAGGRDCARKIEDFLRPTGIAQNANPDVGVADMLNLVGKLRIEERDQVVLSPFPTRFDLVLDGIDAGGLEASVLYGQTPDE